MPTKDMYIRSRSHVHQKESWIRWYQEKVDDNYHFNMRREMETFCESDVKLLKAGCQKFREEFWQHTYFDPIEKCVTLASACNCLWRKKLVPIDTIASQPPRWWHGSLSNQYIKALQWLAWCERQLPYTIGDRIWTVRNRGEMRIAPTTSWTDIRHTWSNHSTPLRVWVPPLSMARVSTLFSKKPRQVSHSTRWLHHARSVRIHSQKTRSV